MDFKSSIEQIVDSFDINAQNQEDFQNDVMMFDEMISNFDVLARPMCNQNIR